MIAQNPPHSAPAMRPAVFPASIPLPGILAKTRASRIAFLGDSITNAWYDQTNSPSHLAPHFAATALGLCGWPAEVILNPLNSNGYDWGYGGASADEMLRAEIYAAVIPRLLTETERGDLVVIAFGTNDIGKGRTPQQTSDDVLAIAQIFKAAGRKPVVCLILPRLNDDPETDDRVAANALTKAACAAAGIACCDWYDSLIPQSAVNYAETSPGVPDPVHPGPIGHSRAGTVLGAVLAPMLVPRVAEEYDWISSNSELLGATGQNAPTGFGMIATAGRITYSNVSHIESSDDFGQWREWTVTNNEVGPGIFGINQTVNGSWAQGTVIGMTLDLETEWVSGVGVRSYQQYFIDNVGGLQLAGVNQISSAEATTLNSFGTGLPDFSGRYQTRPYPIPSAWTQARLYSTVVLHPGSVVQVRMRNVGIFAVS